MAHRTNPHLVMITNPGSSESAAWRRVIELAEETKNSPSPTHRKKYALQLVAIAEKMLRQVQRGVHRNPPSGKKFSNDVQAIVYDHLTEGPRVHGFGNADPDLRTRGRTLSITGLRDRTDVAMYAMADGSIHIASTKGKRLWREDK